WLEFHPDPSPGTPLFTALDRRTGSDVLRLSARSVARVLQAHCRAAGVCEFAPHALRHAAITHALDATNGDVRRVRAYSRHARLDTLTIYDDHRTNGAAEVASLVAL
ncbi:integrase, partial [Myxococcota bacterium]